MNLMRLVAGRGKLVLTNPAQALPMDAPQVALIPSCTECEARWLPADQERWGGPGGESNA